jgi:hypothetical protein
LVVSGWEAVMSAHAWPGDHSAVFRCHRAAVGGAAAIVAV